MNQELLREEDGLVTHRGLVTDNKLKPSLDDSQLFLVHLTEGSRRMYEDRLLRQVEQVGGVGGLVGGWGAGHTGHSEKYFTLVEKKVEA